MKRASAVQKQTALAFVIPLNRQWQYQAFTTCRGSVATCTLTLSQHRSIRHNTHAAGPTRAQNQNPPPTAVNLRVNPLPTTLPPPLEVAPRKPHQSLFSYLFASGKAYLTFYKTGLRSVWANRKAAQEVRARIRGQVSSSSKQPRGSLDQAAGLLTRAEFQLLRRDAHAIARIPVFVLVLLVCGEFTPLVVVFLTGVVPVSCRIPSQIRKQFERAAQRRDDSWRQYRAGTAEDRASSDGSLRQKSAASLDALDPLTARHIARILDAHVAFLDRVPLPASFVKMRLKARMRYLLQDDALLARDGGVEGLSAQEVEYSCAERGFHVVDKNEREMRVWLKQWVERSTQRADTEEAREANVFEYILRQ